MSKVMNNKKRKITTSKENSETVKSMNGLTAYMIFCKENRQLVQEENPDCDFRTLGQELGRRWKDLPSADKAKYKDKSAKAKSAKEKEAKNEKEANEKEAKAKSTNEAKTKDKSTKEKENKTKDKPRWRVRYLGGRDLEYTKENEMYCQATDISSIQRWCMVNNKFFCDGMFDDVECDKLYKSILDQDHCTNDHTALLRDLFSEGHKKKYFHTLTDTEVDRLWDFCNTRGEGLQEGLHDCQKYSVTIERFPEPNFIDI
jgi:hypothetical protein